jgi:hypothetical protein
MSPQSRLAKISVPHRSRRQLFGLVFQLSKNKIFDGGNVAAGQQPFFPGHRLRLKMLAQQPNFGGYRGTFATR